MMSESKIEYPYRSAICTALRWVSTVSGTGSGQKPRSMSRARRISIQASKQPSLIQKLRTMGRLGGRALLPASVQASHGPNGGRHGRRP